MIKKIIAWLVGISVLIAFLFSLILTPTGLKVSLRLARYFLPGTLRYSSVEGIILSPIAIKGIDYQSDNYHIHIKTLEWRWNLNHLWKKHFTLDHLNSKDATVIIYPSNKKTNDTKNSTTKKHPPLQLTWSVILHNIELHNTKIFYKTHQLAAIDTLSIAGGITRKKIDLSSHSIFSTPQHLTDDLELKGQLNNYHILAQITQKNSKVSLSGSGNTKHVSLDLQGSQIFSGTISGKLFHSFISDEQKIKLKASSIHLDQINPALQSTLNVLLKYRQIPSDKRLKKEGSIQISSANNSLSSQFKHNALWDISWKLHFNKIHDFYPGGSGTLSTQGNFTGTVQHPHSTGTISSEQLKVFPQALGHLNAHWNINDHKISKLFSLQAKVFDNNKINARDINITALGSPWKNTVKLQANINAIPTAITLDNTTLNDGFTALIKSFSINPAYHDPLFLTKPSTLTVSGNRIDMPNTCLKNTSESLCFNFSKNSQQQWKAALKAQKIPLYFLYFLSHDNLSTTTKASISAFASGFKQQLQQFDFSSTLSGGKIHYQTNDNNFDVSIKQSQLNASLKNNSANATINLELPNKNYIKARLQTKNITADDNNKVTLKGAIQANINNISLLAKRLFNARIVKGQLQSNLKLSGTLAQPTVQGNLAIKKAVVAIPSLGLSFNNISSDLHAQKNKMRLATRLTSGKDTLILNSTTLLNKPYFPTHAHLSAKDFPFMDTPEFHIKASPDINISLDRNRCLIEGNVLLAEATLKPIISKNIITLPSEDIIYSQKNKSKKPTFDLKTKLNIILGDNIQINIKGLSGKLSGKALITSSTKTALLANGNITIHNGKFQQYGQMLEIFPGSSLIFSNSPVNNPNLSLTAGKKIQIANSLSGSMVRSSHIIVGVNVTGKLKHPKIKLYSDPPTLSQSQILSFLLLGYQLDATTTQQNQNFFAALSALKLADASIGDDASGGFSNNIISALGLTEFGVDTSASTDALGNITNLNAQSSFTVGRYFSKYLYTRYSQYNNLFQVRLIFNKNWSIQPATSTLGTGVDLLYSFTSK